MENKIARICWNTKNWVQPSGPDGKSRDPKSFECERGYGHEEWLRDSSKLIDGWKFSFLQPINTKNKIHTGKRYSVWLYTVSERRKLCIGRIKQVDCLTREEAQSAVEVYKNQGWFDEMERQLENFEVKAHSLIEENALDNFNIKFKPSELEWFEKPLDITEIYRNNRYVLMDLTDSDFNNKYTLEDDLSYDLKDIIANSVLSDSERETRVMARIGQGQFRKNVIGLWKGERCVVTLVDIPEMLIASHIKAWKDCSGKDERLDGANGILLCAHVDKLFDNHMITFIPDQRDRYYLKVSKLLDKAQLKGLGIERDYELNISSLSPDARKRFKYYMQHHNDEFMYKEN